MTRKQRLRRTRLYRRQFLLWFIQPFKHPFQMNIVAALLLKAKSSRGDARLILNLYRTRKPK